MKTKLTLTVHKHIIDRAKRIAKERNMSLSSLFEEVFANDKQVQKVNSDKELAFDRLFKLVEKSKPQRILNKKDWKKERVEYLAKKHA